MVHFFRGSKIQNRSYLWHILNMTHCGGKQRWGRNFSFHALLYCVLFKMNSKEVEPPQVAVSPQAINRHSVPEKVGRRIFLFRNLAFYCSLASSVVTGDKQHNTSYLSPHLLPATSVLHYFDQRAIDYILDINGCATNIHKCSNENVICLSIKGSFKCICKHGFSGDIHKCIGLASSKNTCFTIIMCSDYNT